jgi:hypothetical protein
MPSSTPEPSGTLGVRSPSRYGSSTRPPAPAGAPCDGQIVERRVVQAEKRAHLLGDRGDVHRAKQRQPAAGRGAERRDLALRIDHRLLREGVDRAARAEAGGDHAGRDVARADGAHHVVAAAGADDDVARQAVFPREVGPQQAGGLSCEPESGGSQSARWRSMALIAAFDQTRLRTSISAVPDASPYSMK